MSRKSPIVLCLFACTLTCPMPALSCDLALLLLIDVSGSVDPVEYRFQTDGLADALSDPEVADALLASQAALEVVEWSGAGQQTVVVPWTRMLDQRQVADFGRRVRKVDRSWDGSDTAVGDAIAFAVREFKAVSDCERRVIDISGDGDQNAGGPLPPSRWLAITAGIGINAIAIEGIGVSITEFYRRRVITSKGFVMTARGHGDYPRAIRAKLLREIERPSM